MTSYSWPPQQVRWPWRRWWRVKGRPQLRWASFITIRSLEGICFSIYIELMNLSKRGVKRWYFGAKSAISLLGWFLLTRYATLMKTKQPQLVIHIPRSTIWWIGKETNAIQTGGHSAQLSMSWSPGGLNPQKPEQLRARSTATTFTHNKLITPWI